MPTSKLKAGNTISCIRNDGRLPLTITLTCTEFTWNCPAIAQPDYGRLFITYIPDKRVIETKSLKMYLQKYRYLNAYNEELVNRITCDLIYYVQPLSIEVKLDQNSRGGIRNSASVAWFRETDGEAWAKMGYKPKNDFRGGWAMLGEK